MSEIETARELYEVWCRLASQGMRIRVRQTSPEAASRDVLAHRPGWSVESVTRWAGAAWVPA